MVNTCATRTQEKQDASTDYFRSGLVSICGTVTARHWVPRVVQDIFRTAPAEILAKELPDIMKVLTKVADDSLLKPDLLENIPNIAAQALENSKRVAALKDVIGDYLIPLVVRNLGCSDTGVDKKAQSTLIQMIERGYVTKCQAEIKICPSILALTKMESQLDVNSGAVTLMSKLAPLLGKDITERILLKRFTELCSTHLFYVRKLSASYFGHYCAVVGKEAFEKTLLPCYLALCHDQIWGVRKSCAEVIMFISCVCPPELRKTLLASAFTELLQDECRWVRMSAFQTLGAFISTFADPPLTSIGYNTSGELVMFNQHGNEFHPGGIDGFTNPGTVSYKEELLSISLTDLIGNPVELFKDSDEVTDLDEGDQDLPSKNDETEEDKEENKISSDGDQATVTGVKESAKTEEKPIKQNDKQETTTTENTKIQEVPIKTEENGTVLKEQDIQLASNTNMGQTTRRVLEEQKHEDDLLSYNEYNYWYISPPDVDLQGLEDDVDTAQAESMSESSNEDIVTNHLEELYATISLNDSPNSDERQNESIQTSGDNKGDNLDNKSSDVSTVNSSTTIEVKEPPQKIVPQALIDKFVSMAHSEFNFNDNDMSFHCAYSLPAVVLTLGKDNWPLLKDTMDVLAGHMSYKIRRTVASSLHEIASILGPEIATEHLSPLFEGFLKDLDEVRIGILNNLFLFLKLISVEMRATFLPKLGEFLRVDNVCNWRFQEKLADQLTLCVQLFSPTDVVKHIGLYAQALMLYNVAAVRQAAMILVTEIVSQISKDHGLVSSYLSVIAERFAHSKKWKPRQTFAILCIELLNYDAMELDEFAGVMLPHLLDLSWDPVANVRLVVANCIVKELVHKEYFVDPDNEHIESLTNVLRRLQADKDRDVRMSADLGSI